MNLDIAVDAECVDLVDSSAGASVRPVELSAAQKLDLVSRLATDDAFRELFRADNAAALRAAAPQVLEANARDVAQGQANGLTGAMLDRLKLDEARLEGLPGILDVTRTNCRLGEKAMFAEVLRQMQNGQFALAMAMHVPQIKVAGSVDWIPENRPPPRGRFSAGW